MKEFDVYDEVLVKDCTEEQVNEALDCRCIKVWKNEIDLRCKVVVRGCFQNVEKNEEDNLFCLDTFARDNEIVTVHGNVSKLGNNPGRCEHCLLACTNVWRSVCMASKGVLPEW